MPRLQTAIVALLLTTFALRTGAATSSEAIAGREAGQANAGADSTQRIIVKFRERTTEASASSAGGRSMRDFSRSTGVELSFVRDMATGATVLSLPAAQPLVEVSAIAKRIATNADVEYAEPDIRMYPLLTPGDPRFGDQWHLTDYLGGINAPAAWDITTGSAGTVVAILDTGRTLHPDLDARLLPAYDFISDPLAANDGDGRDADNSDAGNWLTAAEKAAEPRFSDCTVRDSNWHGTMVAGVLGAATQNGRDTAGIDWAARILPVRVLGKCGGLTSDIADAMMWASGFPVPGVPENHNPAKILNLSLGAVTNCSNTYQNVITQLVAAGKIIVVAAGNEDSSADNSPASCVGVINVAAIGHSGSKASYSSYGSKVSLAAPGGDGSDLVTLGNTGTTVPVAATVTSTSGTSFSAPVVSGVISLMLAIRPDLDSSSAKRILTASARPFPDATCDTSICGAGIVDAAAALRSTRDQSIAVATSVGFRDADVGRPNADIVLKVTNLASGTVMIGPSLVTGDGDFATSGNTCTNVSLSSGGSCSINLRFNPIAPDLRRGELSFTASDGRLYRVSLSGFAYASAPISEQTAGTSGGPLYIARAVDGNYWYTQTGGANRVARMTPSGQVSEYSLPNAGSTPFDIVAGSDGNMWFTELDGGRIGRITPTGVITEFALPVSTSQPRGIATGPDGNIWFTEITAAKIGRISPQGVITEFDIPWFGASPRGITSGPDGNLWFTDAGEYSIGRVTTAGIITRFAIPWASDSPRAITTGPDGNLWFTELVGNRIGRITPAGVMTQFPLPRPGTSPLGISAGPDGAVWFTGNDANRIGRLDTASGQITEYNLPSAGSDPIGIVIGPNNVMWIANSASSVNKIAKLSIAGVSGANVYSDMWWAGQAENGWGMSIQQHGNVQFNALYVYDSAGKPVWYVMPGGTWNADYTRYSGPIYQPTSAPLNNYSPAQFVVGASPGNVTITFTGPATATMQYNINGIAGQKSIQRQTFGSGTAPLLVGDMWWGGASQDGWGINLVQQGGIVFGVWYTYGTDGKSAWYVLPTGSWNGNSYNGTFYSTTGSAWLGTIYNPGQLVATPAGNLNFNFSNANAANMNYTFTAGPFAGTTQSKPLTRQPY